uniref:uncharacterized protein LOC105351455 isoform X2 n=1 Tax=Fragaria vesca subsp. vesca TaxID=101020 RepID=UPI0005C8C411|nr:PREDICTED: uncharacterized protein LOC105351455 isoform X2 [Fragaria vesca subsp. vesca]XP_011464029.1 PREDICTED: uncharacterized protein LOC105351455 isoform X2 [Fragaria vesca subsp. vesca]
MSNTGKIKAESSDAKNGSIQKTTGIYTAGDQLTEAGQQLKIGEFTSVSISLKTAGQHLIASGLSGPGNLLLAAGDSFGEVASSRPAFIGHPEIQRQPGTSQSSVGSSQPGTSQSCVGSSSQPFLGYFSPAGASNQGKLDIADSEPTLEFNELTFSEAAASGHSGGSLPGSEASHSSSGSGSDSSDRDGEVIVGSYRPPSFLKNLRRR